MIALDLCCCAGGTSDGLRRAGFDPHGVDIEDQPEYPYIFNRMSALDVPLEWFRSASFVWASPPCQNDTAYKRRAGHVRPVEQLIPAMRELLEKSGLPYCIENVPGAPLKNPFKLCGSMFGLDVRRHRIFETNFPVPKPPPCAHPKAPRFPGATNRAKNSRSTVEVGVYRIPVATQRAAMGVDRPVSLGKLSQMVPPAFAEWIGLAARAHIMTARRAA